MEIRRQRQNSNKLKLIQEHENRMYQETGKKALISYDLPMLQKFMYDNPQTNIVLYDNLLIDLTDFVKIHPGGEHLIKMNQLKEIGRYLHGNQPFSSKVAAYDHTYSAFDRMLSSFIIGTYENTNFLLYKNLYENSTYNNDNEAQRLKLSSDNFIMSRNPGKIFQLKNYETSNFYDDEIFFVRKREIADKIYQIAFQLRDYKFPLFLKGHEWIGKHVTLLSEKTKRIRNYSICLALLEGNQMKLNILLNNVLVLEKLNGKNDKLASSFIRSNRSLNKDDYSQNDSHFENISLTRKDDSEIMNSLSESQTNIELEKLNNSKEEEFVSDKISLFVKYYPNRDGMSNELNKYINGDIIKLKAPIVKNNTIFCSYENLKFLVKYKFFNRDLD